jgi:hypothetical protein
MVPEASDRPHLAHSGGRRRGSDDWQEEQRKIPLTPQPTHHEGKRRSRTIALSWFSWANKFTEKGNLLPPIQAKAF